jgi:Kelch motif/Galactose oxidase, central domain
MKTARSSATPLYLTALFFLGFALSQPLSATQPHFIYTGSLNVARAEHTATLLPDGKVLVACGTDGSPFNSAELYDPATGTWSFTGDALEPRAGHTATLLLDGRVLIAGGHTNGPLLPPIRTAEIYDPATGTWSATGSMNEERELHTATLLSDGRVLVVGGTSDRSSGLPSAEIYDPSTGIWTLTGNLINGRMRHTAALLRDGRVIVAGGRGEHFQLLASSEIFDLATGAWSSAAHLLQGRTDHGGTALADGRVLVVCGLGSHAEIGSAEVYDPTADSWSLAGLLSIGRQNPSVTLLPNHRVLAVGGFNEVGLPFRVADAFMPAQLVWSEITPNEARDFHTATLLRDGRVLIAGGFVVNATSSAELFIYRQRP